VDLLVVLAILILMFLAVSLVIGKNVDFFYPSSQVK
jgi:hypothetical protein